MRITSTTGVPVSGKEMRAAGPAAPITTPRPTNGPAPMTPPSAIICMCRRRSERRRPLASRPGRLMASRVLPVFLEIAHRLRQGVTAERITELLRHQHLEDRGPAGALRGRRRAQRGRDVGEPLDRHAVEAERARHGRPAGIVEIDPLVAPRVEVDVVLLLRAPLAVVEDDHRHTDLLTRAGEQPVEADAPGAVAHAAEAAPTRT